MQKSSCGFSRLWGFKTNQQAEMVVTKVITAIEQVLLDHLGDDGFSIKLDSLGRFRIRHKPASVRKNPFTGQPSARSSSRAMGDCGGWSVNSSVCVSTAFRCLGTPSAGQLEPLRKPAERVLKIPHTLPQTNPGTANCAHPWAEVSWS